MPKTATKSAPRSGKPTTTATTTEQLLTRLDAEGSTVTEDGNGRFTVHGPLAERIKARAKERGISMDEFFHRAMEACLSQPSTEAELDPQTLLEAAIEKDGRSTVEFFNVGEVALALDPDNGHCFAYVNKQQDGACRILQLDVAPALRMYALCKTLALDTATYEALQDFMNVAAERMELEAHVDKMD